MKHYRGTALLLAILAVLGAFVYFNEQRSAAESQAMEQEAQIFTFDEDDVVSIRLRDGEKLVHLAKNAEGGWQLLAPESGEVDEWKVLTILWRIAALSADRLLADSIEDPVTYGLDIPQMELTLATADQQQATLYVGGANARGTGHYARKGGSDALYLINMAVVTDLRKLSHEPPVVQTPTPAAEPAQGEPRPTSTP